MRIYYQSVFQKTKLDGLTHSRHEGVEGFCLSMTSGELGNRSYVVTFRILLNYDVVFSFLHFDLATEHGAELV